MLSRRQLQGFVRFSHKEESHSQRMRARHANALGSRVDLYTENRQADAHRSGGGVLVDD
jgi:hypothetical protein